MKYVSVDIETCGLDPNTCDMVEFAAVVDDFNNQQPIEKLPKFQRYIYQPLYQGEPYALSMHKDLFLKLAKWQQGKGQDMQVCTPNNLMEEFYMFLRDNYVGHKPNTGEPIKVLAAGKNFATFDIRFIEKLPNQDPYLVEFNHRVVDPAMLYLNPTTDTGPPSMYECMKRAGISGDVAHTALEDALMVVNLLRKKFSPGKPRTE
jgi:DNA polymerase III epsilon subunit-like protein